MKVIRCFRKGNLILDFKKISNEVAKCKVEFPIEVYVHNRSEARNVLK